MTWIIETVNTGTDSFDPGIHFDTEGTLHIGVNQAYTSFAGNLVHFYRDTSSSSFSSNVIATAPANQTIDQMGFSGYEDTLVCGWQYSGTESVKHGTYYDTDPPPTLGEPVQSWSSTWNGSWSATLLKQWQESSFLADFGNQGRFWGLKHCDGEGVSTVVDSSNTGYIYSGARVYYDYAHDDGSADFVVHTNNGSLQYEHEVTSFYSIDLYLGQFYLGCNRIAANGNIVSLWGQDGDSNVDPHTYLYSGPPGLGLTTYKTGPYNGGYTWYSPISITIDDDGNLWRLYLESDDIANTEITYVNNTSFDSGLHFGSLRCLNNIVYMARDHPSTTGLSFCKKLSSGGWVTEPVANGVTVWGLDLTFHPVTHVPWIAFTTNTGVYVAHRPNPQGHWFMA